MASNKILVDTEIEGKLFVSTLDASPVSIKVLTQDEELGSEEITNGDFSNGSTDWTLTSSAEITSGNSARINSTDGSIQYVKQTGVIVVGKEYKLIYDVISDDGGNLILNNTHSLTKDVGYNVVYFTATTTEIKFERLSGVTDITIDNISVKEVLSSSNEIKHRTLGDLAFRNLDQLDNIAYTNVINTFTENQIVEGNISSNQIIVADASSSIAGSTITNVKTSTSNGTDVAVWSSIDRTPSSNNTSAAYAGVFRVRGYGSNSDGGLVGINPVGRHEGTGGAYYVYGSITNAEQTGSGDIDFIIGDRIQALSKGNGTATIDYNTGASVKSSNTNSSATVNNLTGIDIEGELSAGTVGDANIILLEWDQTGGSITGDFSFLKIPNDSVSSITGTARAINSLSTLPSYFEGSVGIGDSSPSEKLDVAGNILLQATAGGNSKTRLKPSEVTGNSVLTVKGGNYNHKLLFETSWNDFEYASLKASYNTSDSDFILNKSASDGSVAGITKISTGTSYFNGDVGIGTDSPTHKLSVFDDDWQLKLTNGDTGGQSWYFGSSDDSWGSGGGKLIIGDSTSSSDGFFTIDTSGNVGIGENSPTTKLDVNGSFKANTFVSVQDTDSGNPSPAADEARLSGYGLIGNRGSVYFTNLSSGYLKFGIGGVHNSGTKMLINSSGNVGIGTSNNDPTDRLEVNGHIKADSFKVDGETDASKFLKGDGSLDTNTYLTSATLGTYDNYQSWNLKTNGTQRKTIQSGNDLDLVAGTDISLAYSAGGVVTINSTASLTEADTLATVTGRGATTTTESSFNGNLNTNKLTIHDSASNSDYKFFVGRNANEGTGIAVNDIGTTITTVNDETSEGYDHYLKFNIVTATDGDPHYGFEINGTELLRIEDDQTTFQNDVVINGDLTISGTYTQIDTNTSTTEQWLVTNDGTGPAVIVNQTGAQPVIDFQDDGTSAFYIEDGGHVGLGITNPLEKLHVIGKTLVDGASSRLVLDSSSSGVSKIHAFTTSYVNQDLSLNPEGGNVGIGNTNPNAKLHIGPSALVSGYTPDRATLAISDETDGGQLIIRGQSPRIWFDGTAGGNAELFLDDSKLNILSGRPDSIGSSRLYIKADGNVGIGTDDPSYNLEIADTEATINLAKTDGDQYLRLIGGSGTNSDVIAQRTLTLQALSGDVLLEPSGNVGIDTTSPSEKLEVNGNIKTGGIFSDGDTDIISDITFHRTNTSIDALDSFILSKTDSSYGSPSTKPSGSNNAFGVISLQTHSGNYFSQIGIATSENSLYIRSANNATSYGDWKQILTEADDYVDGSGTANYVPKWSDGDTLTDSVIYDDGTNIGVGTNAPLEKLEVQGTVYATPVSYASNQSAYALKMGAHSNTAFDQGLKIKSDSGGAPYMSFNAKSEDTLVLKYGKVGVGTDNPQAPLHVAGTIKMGSNTDGLMIDTDTSGVAKISGVDVDGSAWNSIHLKADGEDGLFIEKDTNNVGIGTDSPNAKLDVEGKIYLQDDGTIKWGSAANAGHLTWNTGHAIVKGLSGQALYLGADNDSDKMVIASSGSVGIGTANPSSLLNINSASTSTASLLNITSGTVGRLKLGYAFTDSPDINDADAWVTVDTSGNLDISSRGNISSNIQLYTSDGTTHSEKMRIEAGGDVGIGTTSPTAKLSVSGDFGIQGQLFTNTGISAATGAGTSNGFAIAYRTGVTTLNVNYNYIVRLTTVGTGTESGAYYLVCCDTEADGDDLGFFTRMVSRNGSTSNHPQLAIVGDTMVAYHNHSSTYSIRWSCETISTGDDDGTLHNLGSDYQWQRDVDDLYYNDGDVGIGTTNPTHKLHLNGSLAFDYSSAVNAIITSKSEGLEFRTASSATISSDVSMSLQESTSNGTGLNVYGYVESGFNTNEGGFGAFRVIRSMNALTSNARGYNDKTILTNPTTSSISYAGIDINAEMDSGTYGHHTGFQLRTSIDTATVGDYEGAYTQAFNFVDATVTNYVGSTTKTPFSFDSDSSITNMIGNHVIAEDKDGSLTNLYGLKIETGTSPATNMWSVHAPDVDMNALMSGELEIGSLVCTGDAGASQFTQDSGNIITFGSDTYESKYIEIRPGSNYGLHVGMQSGSNISASGTGLIASVKPISFKAGVAQSVGFANITGSHLTIDTNGGVGIGTASPITNLTMGTGSTGISFQSSSTTLNSGKIAVIKQVEAGNGNGHLTFETYNGGSGGGERMRIESGGDVGIGVTSPDAKLHVNGDGIFDNTGSGEQVALTLINSTSGTSTRTNLEFEVGGSDYAEISAGSPASGHGDLEFRTRSTSSMSTKMKIHNNTGNVTIGTTTASSDKLYVQGTVESSSTFTGTNFILSSDSRLKQNVKKAEVSHIDVDWKNFELKSEKGQKRYGVIAQELEQKHPEFVRTDDNGMKSVAYVDLLIAKNAELEARIERLEKLLTK